MYLIDSNHAHEVIDRMIVLQAEQVMLRSKGIKTMQTIFRGARAMHVVDLTWSENPFAHYIPDMIFLLPSDQSDWIFSAFVCL